MKIGNENGKANKNNKGKTESDGKNKYRNNRNYNTMSKPGTRCKALLRPDAPLVPSRPIPVRSPGGRSRTRVTCVAPRRVYYGALRSARVENSRPPAEFRTRIRPNSRIRRIRSISAEFSVTFCYKTYGSDVRVPEPTTGVRGPRSPQSDLRPGGSVRVYVHCLLDHKRLRKLVYIYVNASVGSSS